MQPKILQMLNYETKWMSRDQIVEATYDAALRLNRVKYKHGLIKRRTFEEIEGRIRRAQNIIRAIDQKLAGSPQQGGSSAKGQTGNVDLSPEALKVSTICDKNELRWPVRLFMSSYHLKAKN